MKENPRPRHNSCLFIKKKLAFPFGTCWEDVLIKIKSPLKNQRCHKSLWKAKLPSGHGHSIPTGGFLTSKLNCRIFQLKIQRKHGKKPNLCMMPLSSSTMDVCVMVYFYCPLLFHPRIPFLRTQSSRTILGIFPHQMFAISCKISLFLCCHLVTTEEFSSRNYLVMSLTTSEAVELVFLSK